MTAVACAKCGCAAVATHVPVVQLRVTAGGPPAEVYIPMSLCREHSKELGVDDLWTAEHHTHAVGELTARGLAAPVRAFTTLKWREVAYG